MALKSGQTPLERLHSLDANQRGVLSQWSIRTVEDLIGMIESAPERVGSLLDADAGAMERLRAEAYDAIPPHVRQVLEQQRGRRFALGALPPSAPQPHR